MKRILAVFLALTLLLPAAALGEGTLGGLYQSGMKLLFQTDNVTVSGDAEFFLDGVRFKTAHGEYIQNGYRAYQKLSLLTPLKAGGEMETGYTVFDEAGDVYVLEAFQPGVYFHRDKGAENTILQNTVYLSQLLELGLNLMEPLEDKLAEQLQVTETDGGGKEITLTMNGADPLTDAAINLFWDYAMQRFFHVSYDDLPPVGYADMNDFITVTEGICYTVKSVALRNATVSVTADEYNRLKAVKGDVTLLLTGTSYSDRPLRITFQADMKDYGTSATEPFDAEKLNVTLYQPEWETDEE